MSHTPGPWHVARENDGTGVRRVAGLGAWRIVHDGLEEGDAAEDAALIAAAPELLEALRKAVEWIEEIEDYGYGPSCGADGLCALCLGTKAIAKAEGRQ